MAGNVVGIDKSPPNCPFCGANPSCPDLTCPRLSAAELFDDNTIAAVEFFPPEVWKPKHG